MTIEVKHRIPVTVETLQIQLPHYYKVGTSYRCMTAERVLIDIYMISSHISIDVSNNYTDDEEVAERLELDFCKESYEQIDEAIFHHKFSEAHRELFYMVNPELRPKL